MTEEKQTIQEWPWEKIRELLIGLIDLEADFRNAEPLLEKAGAHQAGIVNFREGLCSLRSALKHMGPSCPDCGSWRTQLIGSRYVCINCGETVLIQGQGAD